MLLGLKNDRPNFSKIGKYISNKLHHANKKNQQKIPKKIFVREQPLEKSEVIEQEPIISKKQKQNQGLTIREKTARMQPTVGTYRVSYASIDKNVRQYNFNRSVPHFYGIKRHINETINFHKSYPDGFEEKQKGFTDLKRMVGRDQIKGNIRKNQEDPHENRFLINKFPLLTPRPAEVHFDRMSPRSEGPQKLSLSIPQYDYDFQINMKRMDSHIIAFQKQTSRDQPFLKQSCSSEDFRSLDQMKPLALTKNILWNKQLPRQAQGSVPSYMDKNITSRLATSLINLKALQMNCTDLRPNEHKIGHSNRTKLKRSMKQNLSGNIEY